MSAGKNAGKKSTSDLLTLRGLTPAPSQVCGAIRLVPLLRIQAPGDLRLGIQRYRERAAIVALDGIPHEPGIKYMSYIPHGLIAEWTDDGEPVAAFGASLRPDGDTLGHACKVHLLSRMARRVDRNRLRILPLHVAMEGFLALHFNAPEIAWREYSRHARRFGLSPRIEYTVSGHEIAGLDRALRIFERYRNQVGSALFVSDQCISIFVVSHPEDYRRLHDTLLTDFYGEVIGQWWNAEDTETLHLEGPVASLDELREKLGQATTAWCAFPLESSGVVGRPVARQRVYRAGRFVLKRFMSSLDPQTDNFIGESITREDGTIEYLKTYRLTGIQTRRAWLLKQLAEAGWNLDACAAGLRMSKDDLVTRIDRADFGYLLNAQVLKAARKRR